MNLKIDEIVGKCQWCGSVDKLVSTDQTRCQNCCDAAFSHTLNGIVLGIGAVLLGILMGLVACGVIWST